MELSKTKKSGKESVSLTKCINLTGKNQRGEKLASSSLDLHREVKAWMKNNSVHLSMLSFNISASALVFKQTLKNETINCKMLQWYAEQK